MASISSIMGGSSSTSSIYGSRSTNIISGLASGMDTESMIEGMVQSYQRKIISLQQSKTKLQWQQNAYQSISDKLVEFSRKYSSYGSTTNLNSQSFFKNAVITTTGGKYADLITATGKSSSQITINSVKQLASAARYSSSKLDSGAVGSAVDWSQPVVVSQMSGSLTINYGANQSIELTFDTNEDFSKGDGTLDVGEFQKALNKKLSEQTLKNSDGKIVSASDLIGVNVAADGTISLTNKDKGGDSVSIGGAYGKFAGMVTDLDSAVKDKSSTFHMDMSKQVVDKSQIKAEYLSGKTFSVTLNGQTKKITLGKVERKDGEGWSDAVKRTLQEGLDKAFGGNRVQVGMNGGAISFTAQESDTFAIYAKDSAAGEVLFGEGNTSLTSYVDVSKSLGQLGTFDAAKGTLTIGGVKLEGTATPVDRKDWVEEDGKYYDKDGNLLDEKGYRVNKDGERLYEFDMTVNGVKIGTYTQDTALETIINDINANSEAGVSVSYSKLTNEFVFTSKATGSAEKIDIGEGLGQALFGKVDTSNKDKYTAGTDAVFTATVNGKQMEYTRSSNTADLDGMTVTFEGTFNVDGTEKGADVTFTTKTDTDTVFNAIKSMVDDYNAMVTEIKKAYSDMPLQKSNGSNYEPLTSEDEKGMTESEIKAYEEKAKTGILFMDRDLSSLYSALRDAVVSSGADGAYLRSIGINTSYEDGLTTISLDEKALREALETDLDGVANAFNKSKENGAATDGLMTKIQKVTDRYAATTGAVKGILIEKAGSKYAPTAALDNTILDQMKELDKRISTWQSKMSDKVDYYTNKFTQLEKLINQMNSQSSALAGLMGGSY